MVHHAYDHRALATSGPLTALLPPPSRQNIRNQVIRVGHDQALLPRTRRITKLIYQRIMIRLGGRGHNETGFPDRLIKYHCGFCLHQNLHRSIQTKHAHVARAFRLFTMIHQWQFDTPEARGRINRLAQGTLKKVNLNRVAITVCKLGYKEPFAGSQ